MLLGVREVSWSSSGISESLLDYQAELSYVGRSAFKTPYNVIIQNQRRCRYSSIVPNLNECLVVVELLEECETRANTWSKM